MFGPAVFLAASRKAAVGCEVRFALLNRTATLEKKEREYECFDSIYRERRRRSEPYVEFDRRLLPGHTAALVKVLPTTAARFLYCLPH
jgi:hypothetical protein